MKMAIPQNPILSTPAVPWRNQNLILFHGTILRSADRMRASAIELRRGRFATDFGQGFYTTTVKLQAERWARRVAEDRNNRFPAVLQISLKLEDIANLDVLSFVNGHPEAGHLWSLVQHCRAKMPGHGRGFDGKGFYDVVFGPVTSNWKLRRSFLFYDQVSFHTKDAEELLNKDPQRGIIEL